VIEPDRPYELAPGLVRITAANPGVMTGPGTNTYLVGTDDGLAVIDPGPDDPDHLDAVAAAGDGRIRWILVTHTHRDHAPGAEGLALRTGAPRMGFASRDGFVADQVIGHGFELRAPGLALQAIYTPGHASNHLCYLLDRTKCGGPEGLGRVLFTGDHVMQGSTVVIAPPDGDMVDYLNSLRLVRGLGSSVEAIAPGHGSLITDPRAALDGVIDHRLQRQAKVVAALQAGAASTVDELVPTVYDDVDEARHPIARRSLWAHLRKLSGDGQVGVDDPDDIDGVWWTLGG
jgi:glyoxylase-like metal-dependent hydrolase (beta-lactamase superfamily II)